MLIEIEPLIDDAEPAEAGMREAGLVLRLAALGRAAPGDVGVQVAQPAWHRPTG